MRFLMLFAAACSWDSDKIQSPPVIDQSSCEAQSLPQTITFYHSFCYCDKIFSEKKKSLQFHLLLVTARVVDDYHLQILNVKKNPSVITLGLYISTKKQQIATKPLHNVLC